MRIFKVALIAAIVVLATVSFSPSVQAGVSFSAFYSNLSPHGSWQVSAQYGRVWQPAVYYSGWNPYYDGHWAYSDYGWTWVSDYEWGAIPYHYGTWVADPYYGWVWVPGYTWAPSWVVFRTGPDYIGWAPVSPSFSVGVSFGYGVPTASPFVFVSARNFCAPRVGTYFVPYSRTTVIINNTRIVNNLVVENNVVVNRGFNPKVIERASGRRVHELPIERVSRVMPSSHFNRAELRVDSRRARQGLRAAEPVSANAPVPDVRRGRGDFENRRQGDQAARERNTQDSARAPRRDTGDIERHRGGAQPTSERLTQDSPRASRRDTGDVERHRGGAQPTSERVIQDSPRSPRTARNENGMRRQDHSQNAYRNSPSVQNRNQRPTRSSTMSSRSVEPRERSIQQSPRRAPDNRQSSSTVRSSNRKAAPSESAPSSQKNSQKKGKHPRDSDKQ